MKVPAFAFLVISSLSCLSGIAAAQQPAEIPTASPAASVTRTVGTCKMTVSYFSPGVKGRKMFGGMIAFGHVWRVGANQPTTIEFSEDVKFGDKDAPAGKYLIAAIPDKDSWTVILNKNTKQWGVYGYQESEDLARVSVKPSKTDLMEFLDIRLTPVSRTAVSLDIIFENTKVSVPIAVDVDGKADKKIKEMLEAKPDDSGVLFTVADYYLQSGRNLEKAHEYFSKSAEDKKNPYRVIAVWRRGQVEWKLGKKDAAMKSIDEAMEIAKSSKDMSIVLPEIEAMKKMYQEEKK